jgi:hypothetical protein
MSSSQTLYKLKEKAKMKLQDAQDKIECATEITESNLGYELTRALSGLEANKEHLRIAKELLATCEEEENSLLELAEETDTTLEQQKAILKTSFDANVAKLTASYNKAISDVEAKYSGKFKKTAKKTSEKMLLLQQRVTRYEGALKVSAENVERLQNNKPKAVICAEFATRKPERDLQFVRTIEELNKQQEQSRDMKSAVAVETYSDNQRAPVVSVAPLAPVKPVSRPLPPETPEEKAFWGGLTGVDLDELENKRKENQGTYDTPSYLDRITSPTYEYQSTREVFQEAKQKKQVKKVGVKA